MTRYELLDRIGVGGMAEIFRGKAVAAGGFEKPVAIKRILPHLSQDRRFVELLIAEAKVLSLLKPGVPALLVANKLDQVHRRSDLAPWLRDMQQRHDFNEFVPMSAKNPKDVERLFAICEKYLPGQAWWYGPDELTDRTEKFLAAETVREKLFRFTGDELPYTSTVVVDKFEEEPSPKHGRMVRIAATIVVEREGHKAMVIGDKGERLKRIGTEARQELEKLMDCKVFLEIWVKVRTGWADDEARVRSFGYE